MDSRGLGIQPELFWILFAFLLELRRVHWPWGNGIDPFFGLALRTLQRITRTHLAPGNDRGRSALRLASRPPCTALLALA